MIPIDAEIYSLRQNKKSTCDLFKINVQYTNVRNDLVDIIIHDLFKHKQKALVWAILCTSLHTTCYVEKRNKTKTVKDMYTDLEYYEMVNFLLSTIIK